MTSTEFIDRTSASAAEFDALLADMEEAPDAEESLRERVARAIYDDGAYCGGCGYEGWNTCSECRRCVRGYADAAIAVLRPADVAGDDARPPDQTPEDIGWPW